MRGFILGVLLTLLVIFAGGYLTVRQGLFPVGADNPPGNLERKLANTAMDEYVDKHAPHQENPFQPTSENLTQGARKYEENCAFCHGGAAQKVSPMRTKFSPPVPQIINRIPHDEDSHLWWVTKHGIRMTGMPSWDGILSDDDMWKVIAFVKNSNKLPPDVQAAWQQAASKGQPGVGNPEVTQPANPNVQQQQPANPAARPGRR